MQDQILGHQVGRERPFELEAHRLRHFDPELAGPEDECRVGIADAGGELAERARGAGMRIGPEQDFTRASMSFFRQRDMAHAFVFVRADVVVVRQVLFLDEVTQQIDVPVRVEIVGEDVMIGNDHHLLPVPHLCVRAELLAKDADGPRPAHIVGHQDIHVHPDIVSGRRARTSRVARQNLFRHRHAHRVFLSAGESERSTGTHDFSGGKRERSRRCN